MKRVCDVRLKLTTEAHAVLSELCIIDRVTIQDYLERLINNHCLEKLDAAKRISAACAHLQISEAVSREKSLYFIQKGSDGPIKIGIAENVDRRMKELQTGNAVRLNLLAKVAQTKDLNEGLLHEKFSHIRMNGEWFEPARELLDFISEVAQ